MGHSETRRCRSALSSSRNARARCRRSRDRHSDRSPGANGASRPHYVPIAAERGRCPGGQWGPGHAVQASADRPPGHAHPGCAQRLANHVPADQGGLPPKVLLRAIERLRSDSDADVSLAALASEAGLSRFHFCRAFKESTGLSPHAWLRQHRLEQAMNMLRDTDDIGRLGRSGAWLRLPDCLRRGVQEADRRNPERLAEAHALAAIALQRRQSLWGSGRPDQLDHHHVPNHERRQMMIGKNIVSRLAITSPRRGLATAVVYGLSLAVRFTSAAGEEVEVPPQSAQWAHPLISIMNRDGSRLPYEDWFHNPVQPIVFRQGWPPSSSPPGCIAP